MSYDDGDICCRSSCHGNESVSMGDDGEDEFIKYAQLTLRMCRKILTHVRTLPINNVLSTSRALLEPN